MGFIDTLFLYKDKKVLILEKEYSKKENIYYNFSNFLSYLKEKDEEINFFYEKIKKIYENLKIIDKLTYIEKNHFFLFFTDNKFFATDDLGFIKLGKKKYIKFLFSLFKNEYENYTQIFEKYNIDKKYIFYILKKEINYFFDLIEESNLKYSKYINGEDVFSEKEMKIKKILNKNLFTEKDLNIFNFLNKKEKTFELYQIIFKEYNHKDIKLYKVIGNLIKDKKLKELLFQWYSNLILLKKDLFFLIDNKNIVKKINYFNIEDLSFLMIFLLDMAGIAKQLKSLKDNINKISNKQIEQFDLNNFNLNNYEKLLLNDIFFEFIDYNLSFLYKKNVKNKKIINLVRLYLEQNYPINYLIKEIALLNKEDYLSFIFYISKLIINYSFKNKLNNSKILEKKIKDIIIDSYISRGFIIPKKIAIFLLINNNFSEYIQKSFFYNYFDEIKQKELLLINQLKYLYKNKVNKNKIQKDIKKDLIKSNFSVKESLFLIEKENYLTFDRIKNNPIETLFSVLVKKYYLLKLIKRK